ncbi:MAG: CDP-archaeol synthase [Clostridia bacterium]|nr:CDP-archaeol synthase [Clostridia bacterium]
MKIRIITSFVGLAIVIPCLVFSHTVALDVFFALCTAMAVHELIKCVGQGKNYKLIVPTVLLSLFTPFLVRWIDIGVDFTTYLVIAFLLFFFFVFTLSIFSKGKFPVYDAGLVAAVVVYIIIGFSGILAIRSLPECGKYIYLVIFISSWLPDVGAYFVGVTMGKHKLIPDVSPKKTVEGAIGGILTCVLSFVVYTLIVNNLFDANINLWIMILASVLLAVASMVGDLLASLIKRHYGIKDYGKLLPGHGGILDRFDSCLATSMLFYVMTLIPVFANNILR